MNIRFIKTRNQIPKRRERTTNFNKGKSTKIIILLLCAMFFIGIVLGSLYFKNSLDNEFLENSNNPFESLNEFSTDKKDIFMNSACQNLIILSLFWIIGLSIVGVPILILFLVYEGASIGISISYILMFLGFYKGYSYIYISMYITTLINVISLIILCLSAIKVTFNILKKSRDIKSEFVRHSAICVFMLIVFIISSFAETYMGEIGKNFILN